MKNTFSPHHYSALVILIVLSLFSSLALVYKNLSWVSADIAKMRISSRYDQMDSPQIAMNSSGQSVMMWEDQRGYSTDIFGQRFNEALFPIGGVFRVNHFTPKNQNHIRVAINESGNFTAVWQSFMQDSNDEGVFLQRFDSYGRKVGSEIRINDRIHGSQSMPDIAMNEQGLSVVTWVSAEKDHDGIYIQKFDESGSRIGPNVKINNECYVSMMNPNIAFNEKNQIVIVWDGASGETIDIFAQTFTWDDVIPRTSDIRVNQRITYDQKNPDIAVLDNNEFVIIWEDVDYHDDIKYYYEGFRARRYRWNFSAIGNDFEIIEPEFFHQESPKIVQSNKNEFMVVWEAFNKKALIPHWQVYMQKMKKDGTPTDETIKYTVRDNESHTSPEITTDNEGNVLVVWTAESKKKRQQSLYIKKELVPGFFDWFDWGRLLD